MTNPIAPHPSLAGALAARGYDALTPVQLAVLDGALRGADLIVSAQTGSGKTVAFGLAIATELLGDHERLANAGAPQALVIAPTRELALQVQRELAWLYAPAGGRIAASVGGMDARAERRAFDQGAHIVVGTPGRLADHIRRGALALDGLKVAVLDEADEMLNLGFRDELEFILAAAPPERRTLMFSATMAKGVESLARSYMRSAQRLQTGGPAGQHGDIDYRAVLTSAHDVEHAIFNVLRFHDAVNALVFCGTREAVNRMMGRLTNRGFSVVALSGELSQKERLHALQALRDHRAQVCVATDVAARGIDLPDLELVIHADLPKNTEALLHRSGRTGRAGRKGASVLIVPEKARRRIERLLQDAKVKARWEQPPTAEDVKRRDDERLLADTALQGPHDDVDPALVEALARRYDAPVLAAAFIRLARKNMAAPEDLEPMAQAPVGVARPGGAWVRLTVGRAQAADPRWLIPMLCKAGGLSKRDIGAIQIKDRETLVDLAPAAADALFAALGPDGHLERAIRASRAESHDAPAAERPRKEPAAPSFKKQSRAARRDQSAPPAKPKRKMTDVQGPKRAGQGQRPPKKQWSPLD